MALSPSGRIRVNVNGARGKSFSDIARSSGSFGALPSDSDAQVSQKFADYAIQENPNFKGDPGPPGPAGPTFLTLADFKAAPISNRAQKLHASGIPFGDFNFETVDAPYVADDLNVIKADSTALTVGAWVRQRAELISYDARRSIRDRLDLTVYATDARFGGGAVGDGVADDYAAIQAALDFVESAGGGTVIVPLRHRITQGLKIGSYCRLMGPTPVRFPFNAGNANAPAIVADFASPMQWVIDCDSKIDGQSLAYNDFYTGALPNGAIYDCGVANLLVTSTGNLPFGGIRMAGVPGSTVQDVGIHRVGCGLLSNVCFGSFYSVHCLVAYYGIVGWDDWNGNTVEGYVARDGAYTGDVPAAYRLKPMNTLATKLVSDYGMASNAHTARSTGVMIGSLGSTSNNNSIGIVCERFDTGYFLLFAYSLGLTKSYVEASSAQTVLAAAQSTFVFDTSHAYYSGTGVFFDIGVATDADMRLNGSLFVGGFGSISKNNTTHVILRGVSINDFGPSNPQYNITYEKVGGFQGAAFQNGWANIATDDISVGYRKEGPNIVFQGTVNGGASGSTIFNLPFGYRPFARVRGAGFIVNPSGDVIASTAGPLFLQGFSYEAIG